MTDHDLEPPEPAVPTDLDAPPEPEQTEPEQPGQTEQPEQTGHEQVDAVLASLGALDDAPVADHVAVFEAAHDRLRGALSDAGQPPATQHR